MSAKPNIKQAHAKNRILLTECSLQGNMTAYMFSNDFVQALSKY